MPWRLVMAAAMAMAAATACGGSSAPSPGARQAFLNSVYGQAPDISGYRTGDQLVSMAQTVCTDLESGATVEQLGDRVPLVEGNSALPAADLGVVISAAVNKICPRFHKLLSP